MGKRKHGFNWKARQQKETNVDRSAEKKVSCQRLKSLICKHNNVETELLVLNHFKYIHLFQNKQTSLIMCLVRIKVVKTLG